MEGSPPVDHGLGLSAEDGGRDLHLDPSHEREGPSLGGHLKQVRLPSSSDRKSRPPAAIKPSKTGVDSIARSASFAPSRAESATNRLPFRPSNAA